MAGSPVVLGGVRRLVLPGVAAPSHVVWGVLDIINHVGVFRKLPLLRRWRMSLCVTQVMQLNRYLRLAGPIFGYFKGISVWHGKPIL